MSPEITLLIGLASGIFALIGALGSQIITAYANLKAKRIERVEAYKDVLLKSFATINEPHNNQKYLELNDSVLIAVTVASEPVYRILSGDIGGLLHEAKLLQKAINNIKPYAEAKNLTNDFKNTVDKVAFFMREDLKRFSGK